MPIFPLLFLSVTTRRFLCLRSEVLLQCHGNAVALVRAVADRPSLQDYLVVLRCLASEAQYSTDVGSHGQSLPASPQAAQDAYGKVQCDGPFCIWSLTDCLAMPSGENVRRAAAGEILLSCCLARIRPSLPHTCLCLIAVDWLSNKH